MPSTLVHLAVAGLVATAFLRDSFGVRSLAVIFGVVIVVDLDVFLGYYVVGAHRAAFHTLLWPTLAAAVLVYDTWIVDASRLVTRYGRQAPRIAATTIAAVVLAAIGPDLVTNGANLFYPVHDQFYALDGKLQLSNKEGIVQTFFEEPARGSTGETQYYTGADPDPDETGAEPVTGDSAPERIFPVVASGMQLLLVVTSAVTIAVRLYDARG